MEGRKGGRGRRPLPTDAALSRVIGVRVREDEWAALERLAARRGITVSALMRCAGTTMVRNDGEVADQVA